MDDRSTFHSLRALYLTAYTMAGVPMPLVLALSDLSGYEKRSMIARLVRKKERKESGR